LFFVWYQRYYRKSRITKSFFCTVERDSPQPFLLSLSEDWCFERAPVIKFPFIFLGSKLQSELNFEVMHWVSWNVRLSNLLKVSGFYFFSELPTHSFAHPKISDRAALIILRKPEKNFGIQTVSHISGHLHFSPFLFVRVENYFRVSNASLFEHLWVKHFHQESEGNMVRKKGFLILTATNSKWKLVDSTNIFFSSGIKIKILPFEVLVRKRTTLNF